MSYVEYTVRGTADGNVTYTLKTGIHYQSKRYGKSITVPSGYESDGATGAVDVPGTRAWWVHDKVCDDPQWNDGSAISAWTAARIISDILREEGKEVEKWTTKCSRTARGYYWFWATYLFGCKNARKNGWF